MHCTESRLERGLPLGGRAGEVARQGTGGWGSWGTGKEVRESRLQGCGGVRVRDGQRGEGIGLWRRRGHHGQGAESEGKY